MKILKWLNPKNWRKPIEPVWILEAILEKGPDSAHPGSPYRYVAVMRKGLEVKEVPFHFATEKPLPKVMKYVQGQIFQGGMSGYI